MTMKKNLFLIAAAMLMLATSCVNEIDTSSQLPQTKKVVITATRESDPCTKVELSGKNVLWSPGDIIGIYPAADWDAHNGYPFETSITEPSATADFSGVANWGDEGAKIYAVYPSSIDRRFSNGTVNTFNASVETQNAVAGGFDPSSFPSIAVSNTREFHFYNIFGGVVLNFSEGCQDYVTVTLSGNNDEQLSGDVEAYLDDNNLPRFELYSSLDYTRPYVRLCAPQGGFQPGVDYYLCALPTPLEKGITLTIDRKDNKAAKKTYTKAQEIKRSVFGRISGFDTALAWVDRYIEADADAIKKISKKWKFMHNGESWIADVNATFPNAIFLYPESDPTINWEMCYANMPMFQDGLTGEIKVLVSFSDDGNTLNDSVFRFYGDQDGMKACFYGYNSILKEVSVSDVQGKYYALEVDGVEYPFYYHEDQIDGFKTIASANGGNLPVLYIDGVGSKNDFESVDVTGKVVIVNRGTITFAEKLQNATDAGAIGLFVVNSTSGVLIANFGDTTGLIPAASLDISIKDHLAGKTSLKFLSVGFE